jgi:hypothetical protein
MVRVTHLTNYDGGHKGRQSFIQVREFDSRLHELYSEPVPGQVRVAKAEAIEVPFEVTKGPVDLFAAAEAAEAQAEREAEEAAAAEAKELRRKEGLAKAQAAAKAKRDEAKALAARKAAEASAAPVEAQTEGAE